MPRERIKYSAPTGARGRLRLKIVSDAELRLKIEREEPPPDILKYSDKDWSISKLLVCMLKCSASIFSSQMLKRKYIAMVL